jgi:hypothetical protein
VADPGTRAHHLYIAGPDCSRIALIIAVGERSVVDIADYLDVRVLVKPETCMWRNFVIVQDDEIPDRFVVWIAIWSNGEMMPSP